ncbi:hypothetical protein R3P38DRAFT_3147661 [Favolaschia claudopus]|uniref:MYND-type domain-containing protein n=1 Tax=Favolaschia claudopus TaxID=2862362 RepID=A0AAV9Z2G8_9AGAR
MHPDLQISRLDKLPTRLQPLAHSMLVDYPSSQTFSQFCKAISVASQTELNDCLPVFYTALNPARIPAVASLDPLSLEIGSRLYIGIFAVRRLISSRPTPETFPYLWPRLSAWSRFLQTFEEFLIESLNVNSLDTIFRDLMGFCDYMCHKSASNKSLLVSDPASAVLAVHAWQRCSDDFLNYGDELEMIHDILVDTKTPLDDILDGAFIEISDLARLMIEQSKLAVPTRSTVTPFHLPNIWCLQMVLDILAALDNIHGMKHDIMTSKHRLCVALIPMGLPKILAIAAHYLITDPKVADMGHSETGILGENCVMLLNVLHMKHRGDTVLRTAVKNGMLHTLYGFSKMSQLSEVTQSILRQLMVDFLTPSTVYYHLLGDLQTAYTDLKDSIIDGHHFCEYPHLADGVSTLIKAIRSRIKIRELFDSSMEPLPEVCGSAQCGKIRFKKTLKRCSGCRQVLYCSSSCQTEDWKSRHRFSCAKECSTCAKARIQFRPKDRAFFRFLLHQEYLCAGAAQIAFAHAMRWWLDPDIRLYTVFDFTVFPVKIDTRKVVSDELAAAVSRASGVMDMMMMRLPVGAGLCDFMFRLAREGSVVPDAVKDIAQRMHLLGETEIKAQMLAAVQKERVTTIVVDY